MGEIIKSVAEVIRDFQTINLLDSRNIKSNIKIDKATKKRILSIDFHGPARAVDFCVTELQKLRDNGAVMDVQEKSRRDWSGNGVVSVELTVNFYEQ